MDSSQGIFNGIFVPFNSLLDGGLNDWSLRSKLARSALHIRGFIKQNKMGLLI
jgi:hypothetical protein